jgi:hypothetical protein
MRRRRNKLVLWEWSPGDTQRKRSDNRRRPRSVVRDALGAAMLLGAIIFVLSWIPWSPDGYYRRDRLGRYMCEAVSTVPGTPLCAATVIGGWFVIVITIGIILKMGRGALNVIGIGRGQR